MKYFLENIKSDKYIVIIPSLTISVRLIIFLVIPHTYEDAFITFRYAENMSNGNGLVYNLGEKVYGTTTPLFAMVLAAFNLIGISTIISSLTINLISEGISSLVIYKFLKDFSEIFSKDFSIQKFSAIVSLLFVFSPSNISWSIQGMETAFFSCIIILSFFYLYKGKYSLALLFSFLSAMIRIDGLSVTFLIIVISIIEIKLNVIKQILFPLSLFIVWILFLYLYFGNVLPNSMIAKLILYSGHQDSILPNLTLILSKFFTAGYYSSSIITILFLTGIIIILKKNLRLYPMVIWFILYYTLLILSKTNIHGWYLIPPLFVYITFTGISIIYLSNFINKKIIYNKLTIDTIILCCLLLFSTINLYKKIIQINLEYQYEINVREKIGKFIKKNTPQNSSVFLEPIGVIGYYSDRYIYDDAGLISPIFLDFNKLPYNAESRYKKIELVKPDYLVLRDNYLDEFYSKTDLLENYQVIKNFNFDLYSNHPEFLSMTIFKHKKN